jgi:Protein of unknown function (DUF4199)
MKNAIIKYGLISGAISATFMFLMTLLLKSYGLGFDNSAIFGYTSMILAMAVIYFGVKAYRDIENDGKVTIGKGFLIGLGIALISCVCYALMWLVVYYNFMPNFINEYATFCTDKLKASGANAAELAKSQEQMTQLRELYKTPLGIFAITLIEPLPVGIVVALISALILKRK